MSFKPAWWLSNRHLQTIWPRLMPRKIYIPVQRERIELADGDFIDLDWVAETKDHKHLVLVLHGLGGNITSPYAQGILQAIHHSGWSGVFMNFRGCSGEANRLARSYHSGETQDVAFIVSMLQQRYPGACICAVGYSLGGNVLLKWLGETGDKNPLVASVAISVPFVLYNASQRIQQGLSKFYERWFLRDLKNYASRKFQKIETDVRPHKISEISTIFEYDDYVTAPIHGFDNAMDYYAKSSSRPFLKNITKPTLIIHSKDDPFMTIDAIPNQSELSAAIHLELFEGGGHVGFISGNIPGMAEYWLEKRIPEFLNQYFE